MEGGEQQAWEWASMQIRLCWLVDAHTEGEGGGKPGWLLATHIHKGPCPEKVRLSGSYFEFYHNRNKCIRAPCLH